MNDQAPPITPATIQQIKLADVHFSKINPAPYNPRKDLKPGDKEWKDIENSLVTFGFLQNLVWNQRSGNLVGGHQRLKVLVHHGWTSAICSVVDLDDAQEKALNIALNRLGEGAWNKARLGTLLAELKAKAWNIESLGFQPRDLNALLKREAKKHRQDPDSQAPRIPQNPKTKPGDIYTFLSAVDQYQHRLICGDSEDIKTLDALFPAGTPKAQSLFTDPPYGIAYDAQTRGKDRPNYQPVKNDALNAAALTEFLTALFSNAHTHTVDDASAYVWHAALKAREFQNALEAAGWEFTQQLIWKKGIIMSRTDYHWCHEPAFYCRKAKQRRTWHGDRGQFTTFWDSSPDFRKMSKDDLVKLMAEAYEQATFWVEKRDSPGNYVHPTQKPVGLVAKALTNSTRPGDIVLDLCAGSGSAIIGAEETERQARAVEIEPGYCDVIALRWFRTYSATTVLLNGAEITESHFA